MIIDFPLEEQLPSLRRLWEEAFGDTEAFISGFFASAYSPERCLCASENGEVLSVLYWFDCSCRGNKVAYLYAIATAAAHRGRGLCRLVMDRAHKHLKALGYVGVILVPGTAELFAFYEKIGYKTATNVGKIHAFASKNEATLRRIGGREYIGLRRGLLPDGGVVQEDASAEFLERQADLYAGADFILASRREGGSFLGLELLGNLERAPEILSALGYSEGSFRVPGEDIPFSMYLPLGGAEPPAYFGLAFD